MNRNRDHSNRPTKLNQAERDSYYAPYKEPRRTMPADMAFWWLLSIIIVLFLLSFSS